MNNFDVIIIGAGAVGSATAYYLTRGQRPLTPTLERNFC